PERGTAAGFNRRPVDLDDIVRHSGIAPNLCHKRGSRPAVPVLGDRTRNFPYGRLFKAADGAFQAGRPLLAAVPADGAPFFSLHAAAGPRAVDPAGLLALTLEAFPQIDGA